MLRRYLVRQIKACILNDWLNVQNDWLIVYMICEDMIGKLPMAEAYGLILPWALISVAND